ncbi:arsenical-resistance protein [Phytophthora cinnamomi]|uniref:arsenical-resistance protein n=1 Tax=Phytophthora cinnamomi TaxID=4785 RepID=UPI003559F138|nr:arsenical-resistance protein [Phytophthora cinnamomi]
MTKGPSTQFCTIVSNSRHQTANMQCTRFQRTFLRGGYIMTSSPTATSTLVLPTANYPRSTRISSNLDKVIYAAVPLLIYFMFIFVVSFLMSWWLGATYEQASDPAQMSVVGALIEIPTKLAPMYLAFWFRKTLFISLAKKDNGEVALVEEMKR